MSGSHVPSAWRTAWNAHMRDHSQLRNRGDHQTFIHWTGHWLTVRAYRTIEALERKIAELTAKLRRAENSHPKSDSNNLTEDSVRSIAEYRPPHHMTSSTADESSQQDLEAPAHADTSSSGVGMLTDYGDASIPDTTDLNVHTQGWEYYGPSSPIAFLRRIPNLSGERGDYYSEQTTRTSFASFLHNTSFPPDSPTNSAAHPSGRSVGRERLYFRVSRRFIDAYFDNLHHIQPVLDQDDFMARCEDIWFSDKVTFPCPFLALYYSVLSLGAVLAHPKTGKFGGLENLEWSRKLFKEACEVLSGLGNHTNLDMVQCYYMMAKVAQHELNPHVTYLYVGQAVRIALAIGLNREPSTAMDAVRRDSKQSWQTWWCVLRDFQTSFALGRPDGLGLDVFHTCLFPGSQKVTPQDIGMPEDRGLQILPVMVSFSRIMRHVASDLYATQDPVAVKCGKIAILEHELDVWLESLPPQLSKTNGVTPQALKSTWTITFEEKQRIVVQLRYHNLRMVIHSSVTGGFSTQDQDVRTRVQNHWQICISSAMATISLVHETFAKYNFFQTWSYNTTYVLYAVTILLIGVFHPLSLADSDTIFGCVNRAITVLDAVEETVVTRKAIAIIKQTLERAKAHRRRSLQDMRSDDDRNDEHSAGTSTRYPATMDGESNATVPGFASGHRTATAVPIPGILPFGQQMSAERLGTSDLFATFVPEGSEFEASSFWTEWAQTLGEVPDMGYGWP
ncbi:uncharacterized protein Z518_05994 [Rhinocladiella mackenziei CBS 650.93]|uniref:Xylanolytic transcriptional activator regulatory domain-containing protein n=1 Tax=Rhinocladiella mackenziei CBS 650.93 TaxID=1442369 RepID=A0A0D2FSL6_9EURO|nr:uncharacterized protein Z518_05994 [Rhinocladiella mackenziei CBS 650.93]KIX05122.1 hypothetical protein Z518_05994 [Rhinocladiella mackenziei CBS 650.93]